MRRLFLLLTEGYGDLEIVPAYAPKADEPYSKETFGQDMIDDIPGMGYGEEQAQQPACQVQVEQEVPPSLTGAERKRYAFVLCHAHLCR